MGFDKVVKKEKGLLQKETPVHLDGVYGGLELILQ